MFRSYYNYNFNDEDLNLNSAYSDANAQELPIDLSNDNYFLQDYHDQHFNRDQTEYLKLINQFTKVMTLAQNKNISFEQAVSELYWNSETFNDACTKNYLKIISYPYHTALIYELFDLKENKTLVKTRLEAPIQPVVTVTTPNAATPASMRTSFPSTPQAIFTPPFSTPNAVTPNAATPETVYKTPIAKPNPDAQKKRKQSTIADNKRKPKKPKLTHNDLDEYREDDVSEDLLYMQKESFTREHIIPVFLGIAKAARTSKLRPRTKAFEVCTRHVTERLLAEPFSFKDFIQLCEKYQYRFNILEYVYDGSTKQTYELYDQTKNIVVAKFGRKVKKSKEEKECCAEVDVTQFGMTEEEFEALLEAIVFHAQTLSKHSGSKKETNAFLRAIPVVTYQNLGVALTFAQLGELCKYHKAELTKIEFEFNKNLTLRFEIRYTLTNKMIVKYGRDHRAKILEESDDESTQTTATSTTITRADIADSFNQMIQYAKKNNYIPNVFEEAIAVVTKEKFGKKYDLIQFNTLCNEHNYSFTVYTFEFADKINKRFELVDNENDTKLTYGRLSKNMTKLCLDEIVDNNKTANVENTQTQTTTTNPSLVGLFRQQPQHQDTEDRNMVAKSNEQKKPKV